MAADSQTRATLLDRIQNGADPVALEEFLARYWRLIFTAARHRGCSEHTAEEVVQDVMLAVFEKKAVFCYDPARGRFRDWLGAVVRNKVAERRRRPSELVRSRGGDGQALDPAAPDAHEPDAAWEAAFEQATLAFLLDVVRRETSPRTYQAFELCASGRLSGAEVARVTGLSRNAVYQARKKVLRRLRELGAAYRDRGPPDDCLRAALDARPSGAVEHSLRTRMDQSGERNAES